MGNELIESRESSNDSHDSSEKYTMNTEDITVQNEMHTEYRNLEGLEYECNICSQVLATDHALKKHKKVIHKDDAEPQIKRRRITRDNETLPEETLGKIKVSSQEEAKLKTIEIIEIVNDGFKCSYCGHISKRKDNMESH